MGKQPKYKEYATFISYRHLLPDQSIATLLQFLLEYNLVRPHKKVPRHIRKVFRDVTELPTEEDLDEGIMRALEKSDFLFVICSPDLQESKYCMKEISYFKQLHGGSTNRICAMLVRGEPEESIPQILRTKTVYDPDGTAHEVEAEPLFADVRAKTWLGRTCKLVFAEYLRLAAQYFGCSYDKLKKRYMRMQICMVSIAILLAGLVAGALHHKDVQMQKVESNAYATYAMEQTQAENEILALALCTQQEFRPTAQYTAALRSALVQREYKQQAMPVAKVMEVDYLCSTGTNYYLSASGTHLIVADQQVWNLVDAKNGQILHQFSYESAAVTDKAPKSYVVIDSHPDEDGVFRDYVTLVDLETDQPLGSFPFREAAAYTPKYKLITAVETDTLLGVVDFNKPTTLDDPGQFVAFMTDRGQQLTPEEFVEQALPFLNSEQVQEDPFVLSKNKLFKTYSVKDRQGETMLELTGTVQNFVFSPDWKRFAYAEGGLLHVYSTEDWTLLATSELADPALQSLQLLEDSNLYLAGYRQGSETLSVLADWENGDTYLQTFGTFLPSPVEKALFTIHDGAICRYDYNLLDVNDRMQVKQSVGQHRLLENRTLCRVTLDAETLLEAPVGDLCADGQLQTFLLRRDQQLACYDSTGQLRWQQPAAPETMAISPDGTLCVWADGQGILHILNTADGTEKWQTASVVAETGAYVQLLVCDRGTAVIGTETALWIDPEGNRTPLGAFTQASLFTDGMLILESSARVNDFRLFDTNQAKLLAPPADNTGKWAYSPESGYLVRHVESSGNNPDLYLEIWQRKDDTLKDCRTIELEDTLVQQLRLDSTGQFLSLTQRGRSRIYGLEDMQLLLDAACPVYYEGNSFWGWDTYGNVQYECPMYETPELVEKAKVSITGAMGIRTLSPEELEKYTIKEK